MGSRASRVLNISCGSTLVPDSFGWLAAPGVERSGHAECASRGGTRAPRCQPRETRAQLSRRSSVARATGNDSRPRRSRSPPGSPAPRRPDSATMRLSDRQLTRVALSPQPSRDDSPAGTSGRRLWGASHCHRHSGSGRSTASANAPPSGDSRQELRSRHVDDHGWSSAIECIRSRARRHHFWQSSR